MSLNTASVLWVWIPPLCDECEYRPCVMSVNTASVLWVWIPPLLLPGEHLFILYCLLYTGSTVCVYIVGNNLGIPQVTVSQDFSIHVIRTGYYSSVSPVFTFQCSGTVHWKQKKTRKKIKLLLNLWIVSYCILNVQDFDCEVKIQGREFSPCNLPFSVFLLADIWL